MRHNNRSTRLGVKTAHRTAMLRNLALGLIEHGRIRTTVARARRLRPFVEKIVTRLKDPTVHNLRLANSELANRGAVMNLAHNIVPTFKDRAGGYLRILKLARPRPGDCADMALIEWVEASLVAAYNEKPAKKADDKAGKKPAKNGKGGAKGTAAKKASSKAEAPSQDKSDDKAEKKSAKKSAKSSSDEDSRK